MMVVPIDTSLEEGLGLAFVTEPYPGGWDLDLEEHMVTGMETGRHWLTPLTQVIVRAVAVCVCVCVCVGVGVLTGLHKHSF